MGNNRSDIGCVSVNLNISDTGCYEKKENQHTTDGASDEPSQMRFIGQIAILAAKHAEVGCMVPEKPKNKDGGN